MKKTFIKQLFTWLAFASVTTIAAAQYPDRPVKIIVPFAAGGSGDVIQRLFAQRLSDRTGKPFVVENRTGAGGRIGYTAVAKSTGDGYTLVSSDPGYGVLSALYSPLPWDPETDLVPVTIYAQTPFAIVTGAQSKFSSFKEVLEYAKANPGKLTFGTSGAGSIGHVVIEKILKDAKVSMIHVPYRGGGEALTAVMGGSIDLTVTGAPTVVGSIKSGKIKMLATTGQSRWPNPDGSPTLVEQGVNTVTYLWYGLMAPKGTPTTVLDTLHQHAVAMLQEPEIKDALVAQGVQGVGMSPADMDKLMRQEAKQWKQVVQDAKISAN